MTEELVQEAATEEVAAQPVKTMTEGADSTDSTDSAAAAGPTLNIVDVRNAVNIIDYACLQGAFKGWETITQVMKVRNQLHTFVQAVSPAEAPAPGDNGSVESDAPTK